MTIGSCMSVLATGARGAVASLPRRGGVAPRPQEPGAAVPPGDAQGLACRRDRDEADGPERSAQQTPPPPAAHAVAGGAKTRSALRTPTWWIQEPGAAVPPGDARTRSYARCPHPDDGLLQTVHLLPYPRSAAPRRRCILCRDGGVAVLVPSPSFLTMLDLTPLTSHMWLRTGDRSHQGRAFPKFPRRPHSQAAAWRTRVQPGNPPRPWKP